jgi:hypothetical protein
MRDACSFHRNHYLRCEAIGASTKVRNDPKVSAKLPLLLESAQDWSREPWWVRIA